MSQETLTEITLWKAVLAEMELNFSGMHYNTWLSRTEAVSLDEEKVEIICESKLAKNKIETLYKAFILDSIKRICKKDLDLVVKIGQTKETRDQINTSPLFATTNKSDDKVSSLNLFKKAKENGLNPLFTFENYVMGNTNRLAYAIATTIADNPGTKHNPFFLYSGVGLGKTHLIQAIANRALQNNPEAKIIYCTGEQFTNELIENIMKGKGGKGGYSTDTFRKKYRNADLLIIDDIQFIAGKDSTQEEFFHTFNDLQMKQKQIVLASDRPPEEYKNIEERITSRFKSGIMADIQAPDYEMRTAILRNKRDRSGDKLPNEIIDFIAENVTSNIRELEGAYNQVIIFSKATGADYSIETAKQALGNNIKTEPSKPINLNQIAKAVCGYYAIKHNDLKGKRRTKEIALPRQIAMYLMYELTGTPFMTIGEYLGGRDHTTIMHGVKKIESDIKESTRMRQEVVTIKKALYQ